MQTARHVPIHLSCLIALLIVPAAARPPQSADAESIPVCSQCLSPSISSKSGTGTSNAVAIGKATLKDAEQWCASWEPDNKACPKQQLDSEKGTVYRIAANCPAGKLTSYDGTAYTLTGDTWNADDVGAGRPRFRGPDGKIVGRDNASNGLGLAAEWEILCPGALRAGHPAPNHTTPAIDACAGKGHCDSNKVFSAEVVQLTGSYAGTTRHHVVRMNIRFHNLTDRPVTLAYVATSSIMVDDLGQRYTWGRPGTHDISVQGIGILEGRNVNPQFQLDPGESRSAVFQVFRPNAGNTRIGNSFNYDVTIAQLEKQGNLLQAVKQYSLTFPHLPSRGWQ